MRAAREADPEVLALYGGLFGASLCLVGQAHNTYANLGVDERGALYVMREGMLFRLAGSTPGGIEALCAGRAGTLVGELPDDEE